MFGHRDKTLIFNAKLFAYQFILVWDITPIPRIIPKSDFSPTELKAFFENLQTIINKKRTYFGALDVKKNILFGSKNFNILKLYIQKRLFNY